MRPVLLVAAASVIAAGCFRAREPCAESQMTACSKGADNAELMYCVGDPGDRHWEKSVDCPLGCEASPDGRTAQCKQPPTKAVDTDPLESLPPGCCKICRNSQPCGDSCISRRSKCTVIGGCAC